MMWAAAEEQGPELFDWAIAADVSELIEVGAIAVIAVSVIIAVVQMVRSAFGGASGSRAYDVFKQSFARGVLLGLDLLIAADIIRTVTLEQTFENVAALGLLVIVRTFLSWSLVLEAEGRWPWEAPRPGTTPV